MNKVRLGDVATQIRGVSYKPEDILSENDDNSIGILRANNIQEELELSDIVYIRKDRVKDYQLLKKDDLLICASSGSKNLVGKAVRIPCDLNLSFGAFCKVVRIKGTINADYLSCFFQSDYYRSYISNIAEGANINNIKNEHIDNLLINTPNESNQLLDSQILLSLIAVIKKKKKQIQKLDELIKSRFVEMFGDPEINSLGWDTIALSELCDLQNGYAFKSDDYAEYSSVLNCRMSNIRPNGGFDADYHPKYLPEEYWKKYKGYRLYDGDVIIAMTDMASDPKILGVPTIVMCNDHKMLLNQRVGKLIFKDEQKINRVFLMHYLGLEFIRKKLARRAGGSTQINVGKPAILATEVIVPPYKLQKRFADFVTQVEKQKATVQKSIDRLETLKKSLIQKYFG